MCSQYSVIYVASIVLLMYQIKCYNSIILEGWMDLKYMGGLDGSHVYGRAGLSSSKQEGWMELRYVGGFYIAQVYGRVLYSSSIREGLIELKYTGGFDRAQVYWWV